MRRGILVLVGATALTLGTTANAAITIGTTGSTGGTITVNSPNNATIPETVAFSTSGNASGSYSSFFDFSNTLNGFYNFALTTSTFGATITLEQVLAGGTSTVLFTSAGPNLTTANLTAGNTYRFSYSGSFPSGGGVVSGNASFYPVPEPATWALMLLGFAGIGLTMRRGRRPALAQVA